MWCEGQGYTYNFSICEGKMKEPGIATKRASNTIVYKLMNDYLREGRTLLADNYYINIQLTTTLLNNNIHLVGPQVKVASKEILVVKKLKKGEVIGCENNDGIIIGHWKDKRSVGLLQHAIK